MANFCFRTYPRKTSFEIKFAKPTLLAPQYLRFLIRKQVNQTGGWNQKSLTGPFNHLRKEWGIFLWVGKPIAPFGLRIPGDSEVSFVGKH